MLAAGGLEEPRAWSRAQQEWLGYHRPDVCSSCPTCWGQGTAHIVPRAGVPAMSAHLSLSITPLSCLTAPQPGSHATAPASLPPCNTQSHRPDALTPWHPSSRQLSTSQHLFQHLDLVLSCLLTPQPASEVWPGCQQDPLLTCCPLRCPSHHPSSLLRFPKLPS